MSRLQSYTTVVLAVCLLVAMAASVVGAQESEVVEIKRGEVLRVVANTLIVRVEGEGVKTVVVPEDFRFTDDGQELSVHELRPGMQLIGVTITTYETPMAIAEEEVETVTRAMVASAEESGSSNESMAADLAADESMAASAKEEEAASSASSESAQSGGSASEGSGSGTSPALIFLLVLIALGVVVLAAKKLGKAS